ncbi:MAG: ADP-glyceromanno-heptose 6-epimerase [Alphaproteobacteria bacterium]|nr:ADP-glyceromanno-heptose 6-epimerase [Alphaproteobacteria bacterium]
MIIVTGGAGFIGSNILAGLEKEGYKDLVAVDWLGTDDKWKNIAKRELKDIISPEQMDEYLEKYKNEITAIIHMGAISTTTEKDVDLIVKSNQQLTWKLWEFCRDNNKQFIYASSAATYGDGKNGFDDNETQEYLNSLRPLNPYGWSKAFFDRKVARELSEGHKTPKQYCGLKFFNVYGPNEYHKGGQKSVIAHIFPLVKNDEEVKLFKSYNPKYKDGEQLRDFVWVGDIVDVILWLLKHIDISGLFNIGSGEARSFNDLAKATWSAIGKTAKIAYKDMPETLIDKYQYYTKANMTKLKSVGYTKDMTSLEDGVRQYVQNYLNKEDPYL